MGEILEKAREGSVEAIEQNGSKITIRISQLPAFRECVTHRYPHLLRGCGLPCLADAGMRFGCGPSAEKEWKEGRCFILTVKRRPSQ